MLLKFLLTIFITIFFSSCVNKHQASYIPSALTPRHHLDKETTNTLWHTCRFTLLWPEGHQADKALPALIADQILKPALIKYGKNIYFWRFHRRAARDQSGYQFSLHFFSLPEAGDKIFVELEQNQILARLLQATLVERISCEEAEIKNNNLPEALSDPSWHPVLQRHWPHFIMGVSATWLQIISDIYLEEYKDSNTNTSNKQLDLITLLSRYRIVNAKVNKIYQEQGQHSLLHHLSAIFGYLPLKIKTEIAF